MKNILILFLLVLGISTSAMGKDESKEEPRIIFLLTVPRTVSTAFERCMIARGDMEVFHEPFNVLYTRNFDGKDAARGEPLPELLEAGDYEGLKKLIRDRAQHQKVFIKEMLAALPELMDDEEFLRDPAVQVSFLIRDPYESLESVYVALVKEGYEDGERQTSGIRIYHCWDRMLELSAKLREIYGEDPVVVDAADLLENPEATMQAYCEKIGVPYLPEAMNWEAKMEKKWEVFKGWHQDAAESTGFHKIKRERFDRIPEEVRPRLAVLAEEFFPKYAKLHATRVISEVVKATLPHENCG